MTSWWEQRLLGPWHGVGGAFAVRCAALLRAVAPGTEVRMAAARRALLEDLPLWRLRMRPRLVRVLAAAETAAGGRVPPLTVALVRRIALERYRNDDVVALAATLTDPLLNPGERWAELVMVQLPLLDRRFTDLVAHALTATGARPPKTWDRRARALAGAIGDHTVRDTLLTWLAHTGLPRTAPWADGEYRAGDDLAPDPYNANALRGLVWTLSLTVAHPDLADALGTLLDQSLRHTPGLGPRAPKTANACVLALARVAHPDARAELARQAGRVTYAPTLRLLREALGP